MGSSYEENCIVACKNGRGSVNYNATKGFGQSCACWYENDLYNMRTAIGIFFLILGIAKIVFFSYAIYVATHLKSSSALAIELTGGDDSNNGFITNSLFIFIGIISLIHGASLTFGDYKPNRSQNSQNIFYIVRRVFDGPYVEIGLFGLIGIFMTLYYITVSPSFNTTTNVSNSFAHTKTLLERVFINCNILFGALFVGWALFSSLEYHNSDYIVYALLLMLIIWCVLVTVLTLKDVVTTKFVKPSPKKTV